MVNLNSTLDMIDLNDSQDSEAIEAELMADIQEALDPRAQKADPAPIVVADQKFKPSSLDDRIIQMEFNELQSRIQSLCQTEVTYGDSGLTASAVTYKVFINYNSYFMTHNL